jgi:Na+-transporting methylmalonyl-CoA/oxaloacetate decarboxylase gamma subunit
MLVTLMFLGMSILCLIGVGVLLLLVVYCLGIVSTLVRMIFGQEKGESSVTNK